jgi:hypothetical protein
MARNWYDSVVPADATPPPRDIDVSVAHPARVYDYWLEVARSSTAWSWSSPGSCRWTSGEPA